MSTRTEDPSHQSRARGSDAEWRLRPERGSQILLRWMVVLSLRLGRRLGRLILYVIAGYYFLFAPEARRWMRIYLRRALGREPSARDRFRQVVSFGTSIQDRFYLLADRYHYFDVSVSGESLIRETLARPGGAVLLGAHLGSFEMVRVVGERRAGLSVTMAIYEQNARKLNAVLAAIAPNKLPDLIAVGHLDSMLRLREQLEQGMLIGMLGDRRLGGDPTIAVSFLGTPALFPLGPMRVAAALRTRVVFMCGLHRGGNRYHVVFEPIADFSAVSKADRAAQIEAAVRRYVAVLERWCRSDPYNWSNFFDFWGEG